MRGAAIIALAASVASTARAHDAILAARMFADLTDRAHQCAIYAQVAAPRHQSAFSDLALQYGYEEGFAVREALADPMLNDDGPEGGWHGPKIFSKADLPAVSAVERADKLIQAAEAELAPSNDIPAKDYFAHRFAVATQRYDELGCESML